MVTNYAGDTVNSVFKDVNDDFIPIQRDNTPASYFTVSDGGTEFTSMQVALSPLQTTEPSMNWLTTVRRAFPVSAGWNFTVAAADPANLTITVQS